MRKNCFLVFKNRKNNLIEVSIPFLHQRLIDVILAAATVFDKLLFVLNQNKSCLLNFIRAVIISLTAGINYCLTEQPLNESRPN